jgi:hypothetical protein
MAEEVVVLDSKDKRMQRITGKPLIDGRIELCVFHHLPFGSREMLLILSIPTLAMMMMMMMMMMMIIGMRRICSHHRHRVSNATKLKIAAAAAAAASEQNHRAVIGPTVECMEQCARTM